MKRNGNRMTALALCLVLLCAMLPASLAETAGNSESVTEPTADEPQFSAASEDPLLFSERAERFSPLEALDDPEGERIELPLTDLREALRDPDEIDVTQYSYTITPLLAPFPYMLYVQTDNPDPESFRLVDKSSIYYNGQRGRRQGAFRSRRRHDPTVCGEADNRF